MSLFDCNSEVFDDASALEPSYHPEYFVPRDDVFDEYVTALQPLAEGRSGQHIFVHGPPGTGKSATTRYILDQLQDEIDASSDRSLAVQRIAASAGSSSFKMLVKAVNELRACRHAAPLATTGHSTAAVVDALVEEVSALNAQLVLVVDDAHLISDSNVLFRELSRVRERVDDDHIGLTIIAISNGASLLDVLEADTRSTLPTKSIMFPPISISELDTILQKRAQAGFKQCVEWSNTISPCASHCVKREGNVRYAINLLRLAGENAQQRLRESSQESITLRPEDVREAVDALETEWFSSTASEMTDRSQKALTAVIDAACHGKTPARTADVHRRISNLTVHEELSEDYVRDQLNSLVSQDLLLRFSSNGGGKTDGSGGQYYQYELPVSLETAVTAIPDMDIDTLDEDAVESLAKKAVGERAISSVQYDEIISKLTTAGES